MSALALLVVAILLIAVARIWRNYGYERGFADACETIEALIALGEHDSLVTRYQVAARKQAERN